MMGEISNRRIYDLALDILNDVVELEDSIDELLVDIRALNREMSPGSRCTSDVSQNFSRTFET
jgi:hypothetical protein